MKKSKIIISILFCSILISVSFNNVNAININQPVSIYNIERNYVKEDTTVWQDDPNNAHNSYPLQVGDIGYFRETWLKFNLSKPTSSIQINLIDLSLFRDSMAIDYGRNASIKIIYSENTSWSESTLTWNNKPNNIIEPDGYVIFDYYKAPPQHTRIYLKDEFKQAFTNFLVPKISAAFASKTYFEFSIILAPINLEPNWGSVVYLRKEQYNDNFYEARLDIYYVTGEKTYLHHSIIYPDKDTYINSAYPDNIFGNSNILKTGYFSNNGTIYNILLGFDLSNKIQEGAIVYSTELKVYDITQSNYAGNVIVLSRNYSWNENILCWNNADNQMKNPFSSWQPYPLPLSYSVGQIHPIQDGWKILSSLTLNDFFINYNSTVKYIGFIIEFINIAYNIPILNIASKEYSSSFAPKLEIYWYLANETFVPKKPSIWEGIDIGHIANTFFIIIGLIGMFASIPITVYRIREHGHYLYNVVIGIVIFTCFFALCLTGIT